MGENLLQFLVLFAVFYTVYGQQNNAGRSVAPALQECYNTTDLSTRDRRLPATINTLIDLIRKAENGRTAQDARQMSIELIHRFRQDGILRSTGVVNTQLSLPFSPRGFQAEKNIFLLTELIPGSAVNFPNATLNPLERCSLHHMLSSTVHTTVRGDESTVCTRLGRYERRARSVNTEDVEQFDPFNIQIRSNLEEEPTADEASENAETPEAPEETIQPPTDNDAELLPQDPSSRTTTTITTSSCPVEDGVVYTRWGAIQAGHLIAGIAAGLEPQTIIQGIYSIDSRFAVTIAGEIAEAGLFQVGSTGSVQSIGAAGGWNSTQLPRWYFITQDQNYEMTDADVRGSLDGLIMALNVANWRTSFSTIRVSQLLDMYYSRRGVFNETIRACNRNNLLTSVAPLDTLQLQTTGFAVRFDNRVAFPGTIIDEMLPQIASTGVNMFMSYAPTLSDLSCDTDTGNRNRIATDIIIVLDTQWSHATINPALAYLLDNLDVNRFGSNYTVINANDGSIIVQSSNSILDYHQGFNLTVQQAHATGFQFIRMYNIVEEIARNRSDQDRIDGIVGGRSTIALFMPFQTAVTEEINRYAIERLELHRSFIPDLRILVLGGGSRDSYRSLVTNEVYDIFTLTDTTDGSTIVSTINPLVSRILEIPRRVINPHCGSQFNGTQGTADYDEYLEPQTVNYYRISPNFFYGDGARTFRIRGQGYGNFVACISRENSNPLQNSTATTDLDCRPIGSNEETFIITDFCNDGLIRDCQPIYLSAQSTAVNTNYRCSDSGCRFPDNIKFTITIDNFVCRSGSFHLTASFSLIAILFFILRL